MWTGRNSTKFCSRRYRTCSWGPLGHLHTHYHSSLWFSLMWTILILLLKWLITNVLLWSTWLMENRSLKMGNWIRSVSFQRTFCSVCFETTWTRDFQLKDVRAVIEQMVNWFCPCGDENWIPDYYGWSDSLEIWNNWKKWRVVVGWIGKRRLWYRFGYFHCGVWQRKNQC